MTKDKEVKIVKKNKMLSITEEELKNPMIRRKIAELVGLRCGFHSAKEFIPVSEAEVEVLKDISLFTPISAYGIGKFTNEVGKFKAQRVVVVD